MLPYGKTIDFATECVNCHRPMRENDYVFTLPLKESPITASSGSSLSHTQLKAVRTFINSKQGTTSILFSGLKDCRQQNTLYTWKQEEDPNWFGAKVSGKLLSVTHVENPDKAVMIMP